MAELKRGLETYWRTAESILQVGGVSLNAPATDYDSFHRNFFSLLFLYSYKRGGIPQSLRILCAATIQCLRGMVTGCDNLLDDEYKMTLDTDIPETGTRFRSVMDIMVSDRVLFQILMDACQRHEIDIRQVKSAMAASMKTMTQSGVQEASEEKGVTAVLAPDELLQKVHHYKTGILFQCPWDIPLVLGRFDTETVQQILDGLYKIGIGCQILDDIADVSSDLERKKHNYLVSLIYHGRNADEKKLLQKFITGNGPHDVSRNLSTVFNESVQQATETSHRFLEAGLGNLFSTEHQFMIMPSIHFLKNRIGINHAV